MINSAQEFQQLCESVDTEAQYPAGAYYLNQNDVFPDFR